MVGLLEPHGRKKEKKRFFWIARLLIGPTHYLRCSVKVILYLDVELLANVILAWKLQVLNAAWDAGIQVASENALPCYDRDGYNKILENSKPKDDPDGHHLAAFTYLRLSPTLIEEENFKEFARFVKRLHGQNSFSCFLFFSYFWTLTSYKPC